MRDALINNLDNDLIDIKIRNVLVQSEQTPQNNSAFEAFVLKCIIDHEVAEAGKDPNWSFRTHGIAQLESKFSILASSHDTVHQEQIERLVSRWGEFLLTKEDGIKYASVLAEQKLAWLAEKASSTLRSLWFLFVGICRLLQVNDNYISAEEAYWIGLVDEVIGKPELPNPRTLVEFSNVLAKQD